MVQQTARKSKKKQGRGKKNEGRGWKEGRESRRGEKGGGREKVEREGRRRRRN